MKKSDWIVILLMITIVAVNLPLGYGAADQVLQNKLEASENRIAFLEKQIQDIQDNYVSFEALQPVLTDFENYQLEVDEIRNNVNDFNGLWKQLFDYEQKQYNLRGR